MLIYLLLAWPYLQWQLQALELVAHALEAVIIIFGILQMDGSSEAYMTWIHATVRADSFAGHYI
eukprot:1156531-Pelagomonas_calceolata.AAC.3